MAGRPATVRGSGLTGLHYGLIAFVIISVAALGAFILQLTRVKDADQRASSAERRLTKFGEPPPPFGAYYENEATARSQAGRTVSVFGVMTEDLGRMAQLISGKKDAVGATLEAEVNQLLAQIAERSGAVEKTDTLVTALRKLDERLTRETNTAKETAGRLAEKEQAVSALTQQLKSQSDKFNEQVTQLSTQHERDREGFTKQLGDKETQLADLQNTLEARETQLQSLKREGDTEKREQQLEIDRLKRQIADLQKSVQALKGTFDVEAILKKADGRIMRAIPGSDVVYINLGAKDNLKVGMGFEVFPQLGSPGQALRGKASLEVATLMEDTAECRVTRALPNQPIVEGDIVVNVAYEQGRKPKFVVRGDFDLNYDGKVDAFGGRDEVESIIRQWGGQVLPELDESVDFVVIGVPPREGEVPVGASDIVRDQVDRKRLERSEFRKLIDQARSMYIPVITQNQFLFLTGYAGEDTVRER